MKNVITTLALLAASSALASASTVTVDVVSLVASSTLSYVDYTDVSTLTAQPTTTLASQTGTNASTRASNPVTASDVGTYLSTLTTGIYAGNGNLSTSVGTDTTVSASVDTTGSLAAYSLSYTWDYPAYYGFWNALVVSVSDILAKSDTATVADLTTLNISYSVESASLTVWTITDGTATQVDLDSGTVSGLSESSTIVILYGTNGSATGSGTVTVTTTIPEPSTFGLLAGVGALALVASRRRRSRKA